MSEPLSADEQKAVTDMRAQLLRAGPHMYAAAKAARDYYDALMGCPTWRIAESPRPDDVPAEGWVGGPPKVRYFDKDGNEVPSL